MTPAKIDNWLITKLQDAYLWLWDWTGTTVGVLIFLNSAVAIYPMMLKGSGGFWWGAIGLTIFAIFSAWHHYMQASGNHERYNAEAMAWETSFVRRLHIFFMATLLISDAILLYVGEGSWSSLVGSMCWIFHNFLLCIKVRKREPKEFFQRQVSMENAS